MIRDTKQIGSLKLCRATTRSQGTQFDSKCCRWCRRETITERLWRWFGVAVWHFVVFGLKYVFTLFMLVFVAVLLETWKARNLGRLCVYWPESIDSVLFALSALLLETVRE